MGRRAKEVIPLSLQAKLKREEVIPQSPYMIQKVVEVGGFFMRDGKEGGGNFGQQESAKRDRDCRRRITYLKRKDER